MKKFFALVIGLIIFSTTNFANAAHYYIGYDMFEGINEYYVDSDELEVIYFNNGQLYSSKNKDVVNSIGVLFKVGYITVHKSYEGKEISSGKKFLYFYRKIENKFYSVFDDHEVTDVIKNFTKNKPRQGDYFEGNGIRFLDIFNTGHYDGIAKSYSNSNFEEIMIPAESIYKKARELFGVQNNYDRSLKNFNVLKIDLGYYQGSYDGKNFYIGNRINNFIATRAGIPKGIFQCYLLSESVRGDKNNFSCILRIERDEGPEVIFGNEKYNFENRNGEIFYSTSNNANLEKIKTSDCAYNLYKEAIKKL